MDTVMVLCYVLITIGVIAMIACFIIYLFAIDFFVNMKAWINAKKKDHSKPKRLDDNRTNDTINYLNANNLWDKFVK